jgi:hypothetical protein
MIWYEAMTSFWITKDMTAIQWKIKKEFKPKENSWTKSMAQKCYFGIASKIWVD